MRTGAACTVAVACDLGMHLAVTADRPAASPGVFPGVGRSLVVRADDHLEAVLPGGIHVFTSSNAQLVAHLSQDTSPSVTRGH